MLLAAWSLACSTRGFPGDRPSQVQGFGSEGGWELVTDTSGVGGGSGGGGELGVGHELGQGRAWYRRQFGVTARSRNYYVTGKRQRFPERSAPPTAAAVSRDVGAA